MIGPCSPYTTGEAVAADPAACGAPAGRLEPYVEEASEILYVLTGRQFPGICEATVRPHSKEDCWSFLSLGVGLIGTTWDCLDPIPLTMPVRSIDAVKVDGVTLTSGVHYRLRNQYELVRVDGKQWPRHQNMTLADTQVGTFSIHYHFGYDPPLSVVSATIELALELYKQAQADPANKLPRNTNSVNRQGMSMSLDKVRQAGTSLPHVLTAIAEFDPAGRRIPPDVWSPDSEWVLDSFS